MRVLLIKRRKKSFFKNFCRLSEKPVCGYIDLRKGKMPYLFLEGSGSYGIGKDRPLVYVCSPYRDDVKRNVECAKRHSRFAVDRGAIPIAPHLLFPQFVSEKTERGLAMEIDLTVLGHCSELWVCGGNITEGMRAEISEAEKLNMKIRYFTEEMQEARV